MAKYIITEDVRTVNTYTLDLDNKLIQRLNADIQERYISEQQGQTIPYIDLDTLMDIIKSYGDLDAINVNRMIELEKHYLVVRGSAHQWMIKLLGRKVDSSLYNVKIKLLPLESTNQ